MFLGNFKKSVSYYTLYWSMISSLIHLHPTHPSRNNLYSSQENLNLDPQNFLLPPLPRNTEITSNTQAKFQPLPKKS